MATNVQLVTHRDLRSLGVVIGRNQLRVSIGGCVEELLTIPPRKGAAQGSLRVNIPAHYDSRVCESASHRLRDPATVEMRVDATTPLRPRAQKDELEHDNVAFAAWDGSQATYPVANHERSLELSMPLVDEVFAAAVCVRGVSGLLQRRRPTINHR